MRAAQVDDHGRHHGRAFAITIAIFGCVWQRPTLFSPNAEQAGARQLQPDMIEG
jgi:hypothetical protein